MPPSEQQGALKLEIQRKGGGKGSRKRDKKNEKELERDKDKLEREVTKQAEVFMVFVRLLMHV